MKTVIIIQARVASTRLYGKTLLPLPSHRVVLEEVVWRCRQVRGANAVVVATPDTEDCDMLENFCAGAPIIRGPELDVLERYRRAAEATGADVIVRVTSDCPVIAPSAIEQVIETLARQGLAYASNCMPPSWPLGYTCEAFTRGILEHHARASHDAESREHVTAKMRQMIQNNLQLNSAWDWRGNVACPHGDYSHLRWTLDTPADYQEIWKLMARTQCALDPLAAIRAGQ